MKTYLCSRTALDARPMNDSVSAFLRGRGYDVFVPHEAPYNQVDNPNVPEDIVYRCDKAEMARADACVVVGRIGVDCAWEVGWFEAQGVPVVWYRPTSIEQRPSPMLHGVQKVDNLADINEFLKNVEKQRLAASFIQSAQGGTRT